jgi:hypothetical protein
MQRAREWIGKIIREGNYTFLRTVILSVGEMRTAIIKCVLCNDVKGLRGLFRARAIMALRSHDITFGGLRALSPTAH